MNHREVDSDLAGLADRKAAVHLVREQEVEEGLTEEEEEEEVVQAAEAAVEAAEGTPHTPTRTTPTTKTTGPPRRESPLQDHPEESQGKGQKATLAIATVTVKPMKIL